MREGDIYLRRDFKNVQFTEKAGTPYCRKYAVSIGETAANDQHEPHMAWSFTTESAPLPRQSTVGGSMCSGQLGSYMRHSRCAACGLFCDCSGAERVGNTATAEGP